MQDILDRIPDEMSLTIPYLLRASTRTDFMSFVPESGMTTQRARAMLRIVRSTADASHKNAQAVVYDFNDSDSSDDDEEYDYAPPRPGKRGGRSRRSSNRLRG